MTIGTEATLAVAKLAQENERLKAAEKRLKESNTLLFGQTIGLEEKLSKSRILQDAQDAAYRKAKDELRDAQALQRRTEEQLKRTLKELDEEYRRGFGLRAPDFRVDYSPTRHFATEVCATTLTVLQPQRRQMVLPDWYLSDMSDARLAAKVEELVNTVSVQVRKDASDALKKARAEAFARDHAVRSVNTYRRTYEWSRPVPPVGSLVTKCPCGCGREVDTVTGNVLRK